MKKIFLALGMAAAVITAASCSSNKAETTEDSGIDKAFIDSLSNSLGYMNGAMTGQQIKQYMGKDSTKLNKEAFLRGFKSSLMADTADLSYMMGLQMGMQMIQQQSMMRQSGVAIDRDAFYAEYAKAFKLDSVPNAEIMKLDSELNNMMQRANAMMMEVQQKRQAAAQAAQEKEGEENLKAGKEYVEKAKASDSEIKSTPSGLAYKVNKAGTGASPVDGDSVKVIYTGRTIDGNVFDSSNGNPTPMSMNSLIPGFVEALKLMNTGAKYTVYIPGNLAYGMNGNGHFKPNEMLIFDIELVDFNTPNK
ncbi:MAG: FKBP-type peptidyl-prolyl cis-trans isomerase [Muribaculaceae bacterium]|nr:FKBP-type peptidyl-prolyl cis-trans isomerase [Muribaculaceae bacterium]